MPIGPLGVLGSLGRRSSERELLESGALPPAAIEANLRDIARLNRLPGGSGASLASIRHALGGDAGSVLDVGTGAGDVPRLLVRRLRGVEVTAVDLDPAIVEIARRWTRSDRVTVSLADGRDLPFGDGTFDVAHASLLVHHLEPQEVVMLLRELHRVSRRGVVINDLRRAVIPYAATWLTARAFAASPVTRHDGPLSARRAYTVAELDRLAADAGLRPVRRSLAIMPRVVTTFR